jgi:hypothetical protein
VVPLVLAAQAPATSSGELALTPDHWLNPQAETKLPLATLTVVKKFAALGAYQISAS